MELSAWVMDGVHSPHTQNRTIDVANERNGAFMSTGLVHELTDQIE